MDDKIIGVAIEDSHISAGLVDFETRKVVRGSLKRKKVNNKASAEEITSIWINVFNEVSHFTETEISKIGIGIPGLYNYETGVLLKKINGGRYESLYQVNLKELLASKLQIDKSCIRMLSDSASFLQGEIFGGAARGFSRSLGITLGIGLGSAKYADRTIENAQMYNMPFLDSIAEDYICVKWLFDRYETLSGSCVNNMMELNQLAATDSRAVQVFDEFGENLAQFLLSFIRQSNINPELVVIGGYMETSNRFFFDNAINKIKENGIKIPILRAILGEEAGVIGAASLWYELHPIHS
jgi:glucokinase